VRVGYVPNSPDLTAPGDRRRFPFYAARRGLSYELATPSGSYDVVVLTARADLRRWADYRPGRAKLVYDMVDSYLAIPRYQPRAVLRGVGKFVAGEARTPFFSYRRAVVEMIRRADALVCASPEQAEMAGGLSDNTHPILDFHTELTDRVKHDYRAGRPFNLVWEGLGTNVHWFKRIRRPLAKVAERHPLVLHLLTELEYREFVQRFWRRRTEDKATRYFSDVRVHGWDPETVRQVATKCDLALIPLPLDRAMQTTKPETKLVLFWHLGLPTVVSATPSYARVMREAGMDLACASEQEWYDTLLALIEDEDLRRRAGEEGRRFASARYGEERLLAAWDAVFDSI
jgi:glycosyltransferase involved in cell wall biosynthesis